MIVNTPTELTQSSNGGLEADRHTEPPEGALRVSWEMQGAEGSEEDAILGPCDTLPSYHGRLQSLADTERLFDELTQEKQQVSLHANAKVSFQQSSSPCLCHSGPSSSAELRSTMRWWSSTCSAPVPGSPPPSWFSKTPQSDLYFWRITDTCCSLSVQTVACFRKS